MLVIWLILKISMKKISIHRWIYSKAIKVIKFILNNASQIITYFECNITVNLSLLLFIDVFKEFKISITKIAFKYMSALMQTNWTYCFSLKNICVRIDFIWILHIFSNCILFLFYTLWALALSSILYHFFPWDRILFLSEKYMH